MEIIVYLNFIISIIFTLCYFYQFVYVFIGLAKKPKEYEAKNKHRYGILISARNESSVITNLIESIQAQSYPRELTDIFIVADNCTDDTAEVSRKLGAKVYERFNKVQVGKGYALDWLLKKIDADYSLQNYDAFIIFDADNIVDPHFIEEMNKIYDNGYRIITSYRNSKNYDENWISAGYSLWFLREGKFLNNPRMICKTSCAVSGTGFLVSSEIIQKNNGWIHHLLTEDIEFTTDSIIHGEIIGYSGKSVLYDEQPNTFYQSYIQRLRWSKGFYQVFGRYSKKLVKGIFKGSFSCYDMLMTLMPAMLLTLVSTAINIIAIPFGILTQSEHLPMLLKTLGETFLGFYLIFFFLGVITTISEWKKIYCRTSKKLLYALTFPFFMLTYVPISIIALFKKVHWEPIKHTHSTTLTDICSENHDDQNQVNEKKDSVPST